MCFSSTPPNAAVAHRNVKTLHVTWYLRPSLRRMIRTNRARPVNASRAIDLDLFDLVLQGMD